MVPVTNDHYRTAIKTTVPTAVAVPERIVTVRPVTPTAVAARIRRCAALGPQINLVRIDLGVGVIVIADRVLLAAARSADYRDIAALGIHRRIVKTLTTGDETTVAGIVQDLASLGDGIRELTPRELALIDQSKEDFKAGRTHSLDEARAHSDAFLKTLRAKYPAAQ